MVQYLKKIIRTEKIKKKIMTSFIVVIVLMSIGTTLGAMTLFYTTRQYNAALENYGFSQGDIGKAMISFADMRNATVFEFGSHRACAAGQGEKNYILRTTNKARPMEFNRRIAADIPWLRERMHEEVRNVKKAYQDKTGEFKNYAHALHVARQRSVGFLNRYYRQTAEQYGYVYRTQK